MQRTIDRYSLDKKFIITGQLQFETNDQLTILTYSDNIIEVSSNALYHPIKALENLRLKLETDFKSVLAMNGCRIDTDYRASGRYGCYIVEYGKQATYSVNMFDPTNEIDKLCTVEIHRDAYKLWLKSLG